MRGEKYHLGSESAISKGQRCCLIALVVIQGIIIVGAGIGLGLYFGVLKSEDDKASTAEPTKGQTSIMSGPTTSQGPTTKQPSTPDANQGNIVFRDDFDSASLNLEEWEYEVSMYGGYNWEIQVYTNDPVNIFIRDGYLYIKPTLTAQSFSEDYLTTGKMNVPELWGCCTNADNYGCVREGKYGLLPPVMSGKIKTKKTITYGRVDVRAKIPKGDWLWPAIWMLPRNNTYGGWPASGEIDLMESRGNTKAESGGVNHGVNEITSSLQWGPDPGQNRWRWTTAGKENVDLWSSDFHTYSYDWNADRIIISVDETPILTVPTPATSFWEHGNFTGSNIWSNSGKNAPFDHPFFLILNVAVGGANGYFPDDWIYNTPKPWNNTSPTQNADFWSKRNDWLPTWVDDDVAMIVDYVQMTQY